MNIERKTVPDAQNKQTNETPTPATSKRKPDRLKPCPFCGEFPKIEYLGGFPCIRHIVNTDECPISPVVGWSVCVWQNRAAPTQTAPFAPNDDPPPGSQPVFYHGSPSEIRDAALASGTWLTDDIDLAREYGRYVYRVEVPIEHISVIEGPNWEGHFVTRGHIPMGYIDLIENAKVERRV